MKFYGSFGDVEIPSDFFVRETARDAGKNLLFPARQPYLAVNRRASEQLVSLLDKVLEKVVLGLDHNGVILRNLVANEAMLGEQSGRLASQKTAIRSGLDVKMDGTRIFLIQEEDIAGGVRTGSKQWMRMFTFVDAFQVRPLGTQVPDCLFFTGLGERPKQVHVKGEGRHIESNTDSFFVTKFLKGLRNPVVDQSDFNCQGGP
jgi:hypothetical protein